MIKIITDKTTLSNIDSWADTLVKRIQVEMQNSNLNASGNLSNSLEYTITDEQDGTHIRVLADPYFLYAEGGRKPGRIPKNFGAILEEWIADKRITVPAKFKTPLQFGWAIAHTIRIYGSKRWRTDDPLDVVGDAISENLPKLQDILSTTVAAYINDYLF